MSEDEVVSYDIYKKATQAQYELYLAQLELNNMDIELRKSQKEYPGQETNIWFGAVCNALHHQPVQQAVESADYVTREFKKRFGLLKI